MSPLKHWVRTRSKSLGALHPKPALPRDSLTQFQMQFPLFSCFASPNKPAQPPRPQDQENQRFGLPFVCLVGAGRRNDSHDEGLNCFRIDSNCLATRHQLCSAGTREGLDEGAGGSRPTQDFWQVSRKTKFVQSCTSKKHHAPDHN